MELVILILIVVILIINSFKLSKIYNMLYRMENTQDNIDYLLAKILNKIEK